MYFVYILLSNDKQHWYIGSSNNLEDRLRRHNSASSKSTKPYQPWKIVYNEVFQTRAEAVRRELYLKSPKGYQEYLKIKEEVINKIGRFA